VDIEVQQQNGALVEDKWGLPAEPLIAGVDLSDFRFE